MYTYWYPEKLQQQVTLLCFRGDKIYLVLFNTFCYLFVLKCRFFMSNCTNYFVNLRLEQKKPVRNE